MTTKTFHLGDILTITTGRLVSPRHMEGVYDILNWMTGEDLLVTHQIPRWSYVHDHAEYGKPLVITDEWATRDALIAAMREHVEENRKDAADFRGYAADPGRDEDNRRYFADRAPEAEAVAAKYEAAIATLEAGPA